jgi:hypothetical protein
MELDEAVARNIAEFQPELSQKVGRTIADLRMKAIADKIVSAYGDLEKMRKELRGKSKPDQISRDFSGTVISETFSKAAYDALEKHKLRIAKIEKAIAAALSAPYDVKLLNELSKNNDTPAKADDDDAE